MGAGAAPEPGQETGAWPGAGILGTELDTGGEIRLVTL